MTQTHIMLAFDRDLASIQTLVLRMGDLVQAALVDAADALETRDAATAQRVRLGDKDVDLLEEQINSECARLIALRAPAASDLRTVLTVMKIAANLERCGDYAKNLAKRSLVLAEMTTLPVPTGAIRQMARHVSILLTDALAAFVARDATLAEAVRQRDQDVDRMYSDLFRELLTEMMEDHRNITPAMHLHFIAKNIERAGDHATSIAEQVIYLVTGAMPGDDRPKIDSTAAGTAGA